MTPTPNHRRPGELALLGFVARDPVLAGVAARQRALLDDAVTDRRHTPGPAGAAAQAARRRWPWLLLPRSLARSRCPEATP